MTKIWSKPQADNLPLPQEISANLKISTAEEIKDKTLLISNNLNSVEEISTAKSNEKING